MKETEMIIVRPIETNYRTQKFGEEGAMVKVDVNGNPYRPFIVKSIPYNGIPKGWAGFYTTVLNMKGHNGEDWMAYIRERCYFPVKIKGMEWWAKNERDNDGGIGVDIISKTKVTLNGRTEYIKFRFWHLDGSKVKDGQPVRFGDLIALCDNTGASSGSHLHWSMKWCYKDGTIIDKNNGYYGALNFRMWFENVFVFDSIKKDKDIEEQIIKIQLGLIDILRKYITILQIQVFKLRKGVGSFIN